MEEGIGPELGDVCSCQRGFLASAGAPVLLLITLVALEYWVDAPLVLSLAASVGVAEPLAEVFVLIDVQDHRVTTIPVGA